MNDSQILPVQGEMLYTADFSDSLTDTVSLSAVAWSISPAITLSNQANDYPSARSTIKVSGCTHGTQYVLQALGTLTSGEVIPKDSALIGGKG